MDRLIKKGNIILRAVPGRRTLSVKVCGFPSYFYSPDNNSHNNNNNQSNSKCTSVRFFTTRRRKGNQLRVAIIGGGAAGLSSALHLAPLVESGMIAAPIDIYDCSPSSSNSGSDGPPLKGERDIGVGIWTTALDNFGHSERASHQFLHNEMCDRLGTWVGDVGYRTPTGRWILKNHLPSTREELELMDHTSKPSKPISDDSMPSLLFLREKDYISTLKKAVHHEDILGTVMLHKDKGNKTRVYGIQEDSPFPWSAKLVLDSDEGRRLSDRDYHLILGADGTHSLIRQIYGGHSQIQLQGQQEQSHMTGTSAVSGSGSGSSLASPNELPQQQQQMTAGWNQSKHQEAVGLQDRNYTVFRGNSPITTEELYGGDGDGPTSFQTWGEGNSMRFATVPMMCPSPSGGKKEEKQVWFITIDDDDIASEQDPVRRKAMLMEAFKTWHDPIRSIVDATPADEILHERGIAHKHSMGPVYNFNSVVQRIRDGRRPPTSTGQGPCLVFIGDAYMTVDPILAQGFTMAMEGAHALVPSVQAATTATANTTSQSQDDNENTNNNNDDATEELLGFDPYVLRQELKIRQESRIHRLICLLRATELVQALGQPGGGTVSGFINTKLLRPIALVTPNFIKAPIFDAVLKYSLGLLGKKK